jgi:hypothetical protein
MMSRTASERSLCYRAFAKPIKELPMSFERIRDEGQTLGPPTGKVLGIVDTRAEFDNVVWALRSAGFDKITAICGEEGIQLLERVNTFFFSDLEDRVLARHIEELKAGNIIVGIEAPSDRVDEAVTVAAQHGARRLIHFGLMTITWHTK